jgi:hypothetical protein
MCGLHTHEGDGCNEYLQYNVRTISERAVVVVTKEKIHCVEVQLQNEVTHNVNSWNVNNNKYARK